MSAEEALPESTGTWLLKLARGVVEAAAAGRPDPAVESDRPDVQEHRGAFVTLHRRGQLRGCIGTFVADEPLWQVVREMARSAAMSDPRFVPVSERELPETDIEISVLSPLRKTDNPLSLELGVHGIYIRRGFQSGTFLPQVATECNMTKEEFLSSCCAHKAGLPADAWKYPETEVYLYTAQIFKEKAD